MKQLISKLTHVLRAYVLFVCAFAFATLTNAQENDQTVPNGCSYSDVSTKQCINYLKGDLNALQQLNNIDLNSGFSAFEERAFKTRVGNTNQTNRLKKNLTLCLPKEMSASEILASIDHSLPLDNATLKSL